MDTKTCSRCGATAPLTEYQSNGKGGKRGECKTCTHRRERELDAARRMLNPVDPEAITQARREASRKANLARARNKKVRDAALVEDVEFMLTHRESLYMAAQRLGMKPQALDVNLRRAGRPDLVRALSRNQNEHIINQYTEIH